MSKLLAMLTLLASVHGAVAADHLQDGLKLVLKASAAGEKLVWVSKSPALALPASPPTDVGATLDIVNPGSGESATLSLPAGVWAANGAGTVLKFVNKEAPNGPSPVKVAVLKDAKVLKVVARATGITLDETTQGSLGVALTVGNDRYCSVFDGPLGNGVVIRDQPGQFIGKHAVAPAACAVVTPPTTTTTTAASTTTTEPGSTTTTTSPTTTTTMPAAVCGDGMVEGAETCDPPGSNCGPGNGLLCDAACDCHLCGNDVVEPGEQCDDANLTPGDGCDGSCQIEKAASQPVGAGGTVGTDAEADGATPETPVEAAVTTPVAGTVSLLVTSAVVPPPAGFVLLAKQVVITAPVASSASPLALAFRVDPSGIRSGDDAATVQVFRDGVRVSGCVGQPGVAFPDPCVASRAVAGDDVALTVLSSHASTWTFAVSACGNGMLDAGEACDPPGVQAQCGAGQVCKSDCSCAAACDCCATAPSRLTFTPAVGSGSCGNVKNSSGTETLPLNCGSLYVGGGQNSIPAAALGDQTPFRLDVTGCDPATERLTLGPSTAAETGSLLTCTAPGCRFGAPLPIPNAMSPPTSMCVVNVIPQAASGTATCGGAVDLTLPLAADFYLTGDSQQPCPLCTGGTCHGGPNNGLACTPGTSAFTASYPTSHDCPPPPAQYIGTLPMGATVTTASAKATAVASGTEARAFCGFCRDQTAAGTGSFQNPAQPCTSDAQCNDPAFPDCEQRNNGAFGPPTGGAARTITMDGVAAGCLDDLAGHAGGLAAAFCIPPTFDPTIDNAGDLPGPGAFSLQGTVQLQ
jgi:cysteine-rich repeat protein